VPCSRAGLYPLRLHSTAKNTDSRLTTRTSRRAWVRSVHTCVCAPVCAYAHTCMSVLVMAILKCVVIHGEMKVGSLYVVLSDLTSSNSTTQSTPNLSISSRVPCPTLSPGQALLTCHVLSTGAHISSPAARPCTPRASVHTLSLCF
jgi:hypothetical protein